MKKALFSTVALVAFTSVSLAADLPSRKETPVSPVVLPIWTGLYAGLNAGYGFGTNNNINSVSYGGYQTVIDTPFVDPAIASALSRNFSNSQNGFIGGAQFGYNYQWGSKVVVGLETDIQGSNISGNSYGRGVGSNSFVDNLGPATGSLAGSVIGGQSVVAGVNYLGTVRGRVGYLFTPTVLAYGTAGFTYGGAYANTNNSAIYSGVATASAGGQTFANAALGQNFYGNNNQSQLLVGWNAGGGLEWLFSDNWSLKGEAIYWNLGNMNVLTENWAVSPVTSASIIGTTIPVLSNAVASTNAKVNYQGIIARFGVNYHFNVGSMPVVAKY